MKARGAVFGERRIRRERSADRSPSASKSIVSTRPSSSAGIRAAKMSAQSGRPPRMAASAACRAVWSRMSSRIAAGSFAGDELLGRERFGFARHELRRCLRQLPGEPGRAARALRASAARPAAKNAPSSRARRAFFLAISIFWSTPAFSNSARTAPSAAPALSLQETAAALPAPETTSCGCLRAAAQNADQRESSTSPERCSRISTTVVFFPKLSRSCRTVSAGSDSDRARSACGSSTLRRRKWPSGSGVRFFSAVTRESGTFEPATSRRITSSAGFSSAMRPAPRPAIA